MLPQTLYARARPEVPEPLKYLVSRAGSITIDRALEQNYRPFEPALQGSVRVGEGSHSLSVPDHIDAD
jgi:hypothetical protein